MELERIQNPDLVVAIDVGSTYSGYAWQLRTSFVSNKQDVEFNTKWGQGAPKLHKTSTAILLKDDDSAIFGQKTIAFGYRAEHLYASIDFDEKEKYHLFKRFKTPWYSEGMNEDTPEPLTHDSAGFLFKLSDVFALFIKALMDDLHVRSPITKYITNVLWVLTVPETWSQTEKNFMQKAAEKAGIDRDHLLLASEPFAAAIYCLNLPPEQQFAMNNIGIPGHSFIILDLGSTDDVCAFKILEDGFPQVLWCKRLNHIGGISVNNAFFEKCTDSFENPYIARCPIAQKKLGLTCDACNNYKAQLQSLQDDFIKAQASNSAFERESKAEKQTIKHMRTIITELEESLKKTTAKSSQEISALSTKTRECERYIQELNQQAISKQSTQTELTKDNDRLRTDATRLQKENYLLHAKHSELEGTVWNDDTIL